jgi:hypothetical protein
MDEWVECDEMVAEHRRNHSIIMSDEPAQSLPGGVIYILFFFISIKYYYLKYNNI